MRHRATVSVERRWLLELTDQCFHSHINTLYLKLRCPAVRPPLVVTSSSPHNIVDFDRVIVGECHLPKMRPACVFYPFLTFLAFISRGKSYQEDNNSEHLPGPFRCILNRAVEETWTYFTFSLQIPAILCKTRQNFQPTITLAVLFCFLTNFH